MVGTNVAMEYLHQSVNPEVSVVIPCYNFGRFLQETVGSLQRQSYQNWEAIIIDDGSVDDTASRAAALAQKDTRVRYVYQVNQGVSAARNRGISLARGEFVIFLDADDLLTAEKLRSHVEHFRRCPQVNISYSKFRYFLDGKPEVCFANYGLDSHQEWSRPVSGFGRTSFPVFIRKNNFPLQAAAFRHVFLQKVGLFDQGMRALEDWDYLLRCILRGAYMESLRDEGSMTLIRVHPSSATRNVAFTDYIGRVYGNVSIELDRLRASSNAKDVGFYAKHLKRALLEKARRERKRMFKEGKGEIIDRIIGLGFLNFSGLLGISREFGFVSFAKAYLGALRKYLSI
ncbi:glycosyltransferase family 2 protein [Pseudomonas sp. BN515]|uniref:glycosyltransferase family 2 protein n=1 Tax=Pseudomonas sp. BN515 TaxID=2567892 RepID=UPI002458AFD3|nr:glycosyltransferase family 2 protein [Pseudomonas sp. BN515]MDH4874739.1 glycosyltransferase [Pseudomonas sp. BN515]